jgi:hypothetical protein
MAILPLTCSPILFDMYSITEGRSLSHMSWCDLPNHLMINQLGLTCRAPRAFLGPDGGRAKVFSNRRAKLTVAPQ